MARPAGSAASAPEASTIAGPSPSSPLTPSTLTSVSDATAADSWSVPEFAASDAESRIVLRRIGRSSRVGTMRQANRVSDLPAAGLRGTDPTPFRLRLERLDPAPGHDMADVVLDRHLRHFGARGNVPFAARLAR